MNLENFVMRLSAEQTAELFGLLLNELTDDDAITAIVKWAKSKGLASELSMHLDQ